MKLYIAYKAETNFVDVVPLKSRLNLSLNVPLGGLVDPRGLAEDVSKLGRWGNGDYQVGLDESTDFDYVLGLVRQSFERQLEEES
jgi:predicted transport protein